MPSQIISATIQAVVLSATSNILAQLLKAYQSPTLTSFSLNFTPILQFALFTALNTPPNFLWQQFLEETFPGFDVKPVIVESEKPLSEKGEKEQGGTTKEIVPEKRLNKRNTAIKFLLDQSVGALFNTVVFIAGMAAMRGATTSQVIDKVSKEAWPLMSAGYKLWPAVSLLNFTIVPFQYRMLFGGLVGMGWGIFLSLLAGGK
jgi:protein Mpv17